MKEYGVDLISEVSELKNDYNAIVLAVAHKKFVNFEFANFTSDNYVLYDVKGLLPKSASDGRL